MSQPPLNSVRVRSKSGVLEAHAAQDRLGARLEPVLVEVLDLLEDAAVALELCF